MNKNIFDIYFWIKQINSDLIRDLKAFQVVIKILKCTVMKYDLCFIVRGSVMMC